MTHYISTKSVQKSLIQVSTPEVGDRHGLFPRLSVSIVGVFGPCNNATNNVYHCFITTTRPAISHPHSQSIKPSLPWLPFEAVRL